MEGNTANPIPPVSPPAQPSNPKEESPKGTHPKPKILIIAVVLLFLLIPVFLFMSRQDKTPPPQPEENLSETPQIAPTLSPGRINVSFFVWNEERLPDEDEVSITDLESQIHLGGTVTSDYAGTPDWSAEFGPGEYELITDTPEGYTFKSLDCDDEGCGDSMSESEICGTALELSEGSEVTLKCYYEVPPEE